MSISDSCVEMLIVGTICCQSGARLLGCARSNCAVSLLLRFTEPHRGKSSDTDKQMVLCKIRYYNQKDQRFIYNA